MRDGHIVSAQYVVRDPLVLALSRTWDLAAKRAWAILALTTFAIVAGLQITGFHFALWPAIAPTCVLLACLTMLTIYLVAEGRDQLAMLLEAFIIFPVIAITVPILACLLATTAVPFQDTNLIAMDRLIGVSFRDMASWFNDHPSLSVILSFAYTTIGWQFAALYVILGFVKPAKLRQVSTSWCASLAASVLIFPWMPAKGGYLHYGLTRQDFPHVRCPAAWDYYDILASVRAGTTTEINMAALDGIITFPSFHAAAAIIYIWAWWSVPVLRYPAILLNLGMLISSIPIGGHYLSDVLAGSIIAVVTSWGAARYFRNALQPVAVALPRLTLNLPFLNRRRGQPMAT